MEQPLSRAIVTGAAGFLGSHVRDCLESAGWEVFTIDRVPLPGLSTQSSHITTDLGAFPFANLLQELQPTALIHAAGAASVPDSLRDPAGDFRSSVALTHHVLESMRETNCESKLLYFSSAAVYGQPSALPVAETATQKPISPYGYHKLITELLVEQYSRLYSLRACSIRVFSAYGRGLRRQLLWDVVAKARRGPVELSGSGTETRDFIHATDVARAALCLLASGDFSGGAYNVGSGTETTVAAVANAVGRAAGRGEAAQFSGTVRQGDPLRWCADITRLRQLGWSPQVPFDDGVRDYVEWAMTA